MKRGISEGAGRPLRRSHNVGGQGGSPTFTSWQRAAGPGSTCPQPARGCRPAPPAFAPAACALPAGRLRGGCQSAAAGAGRGKEGGCPAPRYLREIGRAHV